MKAIHRIFFFLVFLTFLTFLVLKIFTKSDNKEVIQVANSEIKMIVKSPLLDSLTNESNESSDEYPDKPTHEKLADKNISCSEIALEIFKSSERYIKLADGYKERIIKNGGIDFEIFPWTSPDSDTKDSENILPDYYFSIHEIYKDRNPRIATFKFSTELQELYEEEFVNDDDIGFKLTPLKFDRKLLAKFKAACD